MAASWDLGIQRVPEKQQQVDFVAGDAGRNLLVAALRAAKNRWISRPVASETILLVVPVPHRV